MLDSTLDTCDFMRCQCVRIHYIIRSFYFYNKVIFLIFIWITKFLFTQHNPKIRFVISDRSRNLVPMRKFKKAQHIRICGFVGFLSELPLQIAVIKRLVPNAMIGSAYPVVATVTREVFEIKGIIISGRTILHTPD